jgi:4-carboxymuconolactone decarboxylase
MSRLPSLSPERMSPEQRRIYDEVVASRGTWSNGPFGQLIHQPRIAEPTHKLGEFIRYHTSLAPRLSELAILIVARHWDCRFEWYVHAPIALKSGVDAATVEAIANGQRPSRLHDDAVIVYDYATSVLQRHAVEDELYVTATRLLGTVGVVELTSLLGYYSMLALSLNAHRASPPEDAPSVLTSRQRF